jgi:hypothetical protein
MTEYTERSNPKAASTIRVHTRIVTPWRRFRHCGFLLGIDWVTNATSGFIIQKIETYENAMMNCPRSPGAPPWVFSVPPTPPVFWEAFPVSGPSAVTARRGVNFAGAPHHRPANDYFGHADVPNTYGRYRFQATVYWVPALDPALRWAPLPRGSISGELDVTTNPRGQFGEALMYREVSFAWNC